MNLLTLPAFFTLCVSYIVAHTIPNATVPISMPPSSFAALTTSTTTSRSLSCSDLVPTLSVGPAISPETVKKGKKRGLAFAAGEAPDDILNANQTGSLISWQYNWASVPPSYLATSNIPYVPMQWGSSNIENISNHIQAQGADTVLAFNEPDSDQQSNIKPTDAALLWKLHIEPLKVLGTRLGGPAVTAGPRGRLWLQDFFSACDNCTIDFLPLHWYGSGVEDFYNYIFDIHREYPQYPIWITEYAETSSNDRVIYDFMNQTISFLETLDWVERYAWFGFFRPKPNDTLRCNILGEDGSLNALGQLYIGANTVHTSTLTQKPSYITVDGADNPTQGLVTTYPAYVNGAIDAWSLLGLGSSGSTIICLVVVFSSCAIGAVWILF
ncbi:hypothetical protein AX17_000334 [Amanita inopinata Kibby_2008]|nr:hypothetical protein AX17_000334 [Amanita inopinata Kibby_2008]